MLGLALAAGSALGSLAGSLIGGKKRDDQERRAREMAEAAAREYRGGTGYNYQNALQALGLTDRSAYQSMDPRSKNASMSALQNLLNRGSGSGLDVQSRQALSEANAQAGAASNAARQAILQEYAARGQSGGGNELAARLAGQQQAYGQLGQASGQAAAAAEQRRLEANVLASRAGQQQQQLEQQQAAARDALQRFNVGARQNALELERQYRGGAAGAYGQSANTLGNMSQHAGENAQGIGDTIGGALGGLSSFGKDKGWW